MYCDSIIKLIDNINFPIYKGNEKNDDYEINFRVFIDINQ